MVDSRSEMPDLPDYELLHTRGKPPDLPPPRRRLGLWLVVAGLNAATAIATYVAFGGRTTSAPVATAPERVEARQQPVQPLGGDAAPIVLPPLDQTDPVVRDLPIVDDPVRAEPQGGVGYGFAAPDVEALPAAQRQLLRMGPRNVRTIQSSLRALALALGIPAERLPAPRTECETH